MSIDTITLWHKRARPNPTDKDFNVQLGCHFEEIAEMVETLTFHQPGFEDIPGAESGPYTILTSIADSLKRGTITVTVNDREGFLDAACDQVVTAVGCGVCAGMDMERAVAEVNSSNWSKTVDGEFIRDENGKIAKPPTYHKPNLEGMY